jgi:hypothetical protein
MFYSGGKMVKKTDFDLKAAHQYFSAHCFNRAWDLIDKSERTPEEDEEMIRLSLASQYHWSQRDDRSNTSASIGFWQTSRIYAILGQVDNARRYGQLCLEVSQEEDVPPFYLGYAYEALARAEAVGGNKQAMQTYLDLAKSTADKIGKADEKTGLLEDLNTIHLH